MTNRTSRIIVVAFVLLILTLSLGASTRTVNSTTSALVSASVHLESTWNVDVNGTIGKLSLHVINGNNDFDGSMSLSGQPTYRVFGVYDNISSKLTFFRIMNPSTSYANQVFTGYLMGADNEIAGSFEALPHAGGTAHRSIFGWYGVG